MQWHNYISDVYNKPNRLQICRKLSKLWLFKKHQHNVMGERVACGSKMAPCADVRLRWPATRTRHLVFIYIYGCSTPSAAVRGQWLLQKRGAEQAADQVWRVAKPPHTAGHLALHEEDGYRLHYRRSPTLPHLYGLAVCLHL